MVTAISIVGAFAIVLGVLIPLTSWGVASEERTTFLYCVATSSMFGWLCTIALFVLALMIQSVVVISIVGGTAMFGGLIGTIVCWMFAAREDEAGLYALAAGSTFSWLLTIALFVLALVK